MFEQARDFSVHGGHFNVAGRDINNNFNSVDDPIRLLYNTIKDVGAGHDSEARYPLPNCHPGTREKVLHEIRDWIYSPNPQDRIFWLFGPPGAGKSAIAQSIAEMGERDGFLVSSFFFSRGHPRRRNAKTLFPTIAYDLVTRIPELRGFVEQALRSNPAVLQARLEVQFEKLIVEPCRHLAQLCDYPWVIIVDGLDECGDGQEQGTHRQEQQRILSILGTLLQWLPNNIRLRFLICSRPELHIRLAFDTDIFRPYLRRTVLDDETFDASHDITTFLTNEFGRIRSDPRNTHIPFPSPWPAPGVVYELTQKASGLFIYASTVVKFIDAPCVNPCTRLKLVLEPNSGPQSSSPFADLDKLYLQILVSQPEHSKLQKIIHGQMASFLYSYGGVITPQRIEALLFLDEGDVISALSGMHSIFQIGGHDDEIRVLHASFKDFLQDPTRSGNFYLGDKQTQSNLQALQCFDVINHYSNVKREQLSEAQSYILGIAWENWADCCIESNLDDQVLNALWTVNFATWFGLWLTEYLYDISNSSAPWVSCKPICQFFWQSRGLLKHLQKELNMPADIISHFPDPTSSLCIKISQSDIPDTVLHEFIDTVAIFLAWSLIDMGLTVPLKEKSRLQALLVTYPNILDPEHFHFIPSGFPIFPIKFS
uniref:NACHT domain-containing protein n=1 Tax=Moniliophthora roreri TaxID=221103 RepID=A0A0W0F850_MONRR